MSATTATEDPTLSPPADTTPISRLAQRDGAIVLALLALFGAADAWVLTSDLPLAGLVALLGGAVVGWRVALMGHEWGHFAGARLAGGVAPTTEFTSFFPLFLFDMDRSDAKAFRGMGVGGNVGHWLVVLLFALAVPLDAPGRIALVAAAFAFAVFASTTEFPIVQRAFAGASAAESFAGLSGEKLKRNRWIGMAAGLVLFALL
jgi:hypothetical protein